MLLVGVLQASDYPRWAAIRVELQTPRMVVQAVRAAARARGPGTPLLAAVQMAETVATVILVGRRTLAARVAVLALSRGAMKRYMDVMPAAVVEETAVRVKHRAVLLEEKAVKVVAEMAPRAENIPLLTVVLLAKSILEAAVAEGKTLMVLEEILAALALSSSAINGHKEDMK